MEYGVTWEPECWAAFVALYDGDEEDATDASRSLEWRLSRDPYARNRHLAPGSDVYLTWLEPYKEHPAVAFSFRIVKERYRQHCVLEKARKTNVPDGLS